MLITTSPIQGFEMYQSKIHMDVRGSFREWVNKEILSESSKPFSFRQANLVKSQIGVIRGMHFSLAPQIKIITCVQGKIRDAVVDVRPGSITFGQWAYFDLDSEDGATLVIQPGLAHGYQVLSDTAHVAYLTDCSFDSNDDFGLNPISSIKSSIWDDIKPILSERDRQAPTFDFVSSSGLLNSLKS